MAIDPIRQRIQDDLRGQVSGEVRCDDILLSMYSTDGSIFEIAPLCVVRPRTVNDVTTVVRYAREHGHPVHARGGGSGLAGGCLGPGLVLDFSRFMNRVIDLHSDRVHVQPGVILAQLNRYLRPYRRHYGVDPSTRDVTTLGSMIARDAKGSRWLKYGSPRDHVHSLSVVLSDGAEVTLTRRHPVTPPVEGESRESQLARDVAALIRRHQEVIVKHATQAVVQSSGYALQHALVDDQIDLASILVGSEGTLGLITEATLDTHPLPPYVGVVLLFFDRVDKAARAALELNKLGVTVCDLMDRRLLSLARQSTVEYDVLLPKTAEAMLLVECEEAGASLLGERLESIVRLILHTKKLAFDSRSAIDRADYEIYWQLVRRVIPSLYPLTGNERALPFIEDIAVPPEALPAFLVTAQNILKQNQITASFFAHAGHGQLQLRPFLNLGSGDDMNRLHRVASELYEQVYSAGGTISAQNGDGLSRSWYLRQLQPPLYAVYAELKAIFDPSSTLNPHKIADTHLQRPTQNLRQVEKLQVAPSGPPPATDNGAEPPSVSDPSSEGPEPVPLLLNWTAESIGQVVRSCNGCGDCRSLEQSVRMCPIFRFSPSEEASPRAKANLMRGLLTGQLSPATLQTEELKQVADLCVHCYQCREECAAHVDIPKLMVEAKAQYVASNGLNFTDWLVTRLDLLAGWAMPVWRLSNFVIRNRRMRWLLEKFTGIAQGRKLPLLAPRSFMQLAAKRRLTRPSRSSGAKIVYFTDIYANWFDVQLAECMVSVFQHNGISILVPPQQSPSGMSLVTVGAIAKARRLARRNVIILAQAVRQGYQIVTSEPSAALCLTQEYPNLWDDEDTRLVAENTFDACAYLWRLHQQGHLELDLKPLPIVVGYHLPCHVRALGKGTPAENLLKLIPGLTVRRMDCGCSGMAGTYGLHKTNYRNSLRAGWQLIKAIRSPLVPIGSTECSACKIQMEQGTTKPTIHPLKFLALAYGLHPEVASLLRATNGPLTVS